MLLIKLFLLFCLVSSNCFADCITNGAGDKNCCTGNVCVVYDSPATQATKAAAQAVIDKQTQAQQAQDALNKQAEAKVIADKIANDPALSTQQATITASQTI